MKTLEQELKLQLTAQQYRTLCKLSNNKPHLQTNHYFAEAGQPLDKMVRIREKDQNFLLCYKNRLSNKDGVMICDERECELSSEFAESMLRRGILPQEINTMLQTDFVQTLEYAGKMETYRTCFELQQWKLELDKSFYFDFCDYELECECEDAGKLQQLKQFLQENFGVELRYSEAKSARFFKAKEALKQTSID